MDRKKLFSYVVSLILFIFFVNLLAGQFYWYFSIWYFDMLMHFLGGFWLCLALIWLLRVEAISPRIIFRVILGVLIVGILWEVFEIVFDQLIAGNSFHVLDTISDVCFDLAGGLTAVVFSLYFSSEKLSALKKIG